MEIDSWRGNAPAQTWECDMGMEGAKCVVPVKTSPREPFGCRGWRAGGRSAARRRISPSGSAELGVRVGVGDLGAVVGAVNPHAVVRGCAHDLGLKGNARALCVANDIPAKIRNKGQVSRRLAGTGCYQGSPREGESKSLPLLPLTAVPRLPACRLENRRL